MNLGEGFVYAVSAALVLFSLAELVGRWLRVSRKRAEARRTLRQARGMVRAMGEDIAALCPPGTEAPSTFADEALEWFDAEIAGDHMRAYDIEVSMSRRREIIEHETFVRAIAGRN